MPDLRADFTSNFLPYVEGLDPFSHTMEELLELWDIELNSAKQRWQSMSLGQERAAVDQWLSDNGYREPGVEYADEFIN